MGKLGLIAGGGDLPLTLARHCRATGRPFHVIRLRGFADAALAEFNGTDVGLAELGKGVSVLRKAGCSSICLAGLVARPDLRNLRPDLRGLAALPGVIAAAARGDDALLSHLLGVFEHEGFSVEGAHQVMEGLTLGRGPLGDVYPAAEHLVDIGRALEAARAIGRLDIGQACVSCAGVVLALEAQEGTDAMLERVAALPHALRGDAQHRRGVLAKACKPGQELRVDLPTIGPTTVDRAVAAGLAGIVGETGRLLVVDREATRAAADAAGLFILGVDPAGW